MFLNDAMKSKLNDLQKEQSVIFRRSSNNRTGKTKQSIESLSGRAIITSNSLTIEYPLSLRFRDMRYTHKGKEKHPHEFIYFRPIYGHLLGGKKNKNQKSLKTIIISEIHRRYEEKLENEIMEIINNG